MIGVESSNWNSRLQVVRIHMISVPLRTRSDQTSMTTETKADFYSIGMAMAVGASHVIHGI